jgi:predicted HTH transcriptional regulator
MRRIKICEELGSGIDRVVEAAEVFQLPAPNFITVENSTRTILYAPKDVALMDRNDRIRACYQHAVLQWVTNQRMTNASFRKRMGIKDENSSQASRIIGDTIEAGFIKSADPSSDSRRHAQYVPFWA